MILKLVHVRSLKFFGYVGVHVPCNLNTSVTKPLLDILHIGATFILKIVKTDMEDMMKTGVSLAIAQKIPLIYLQIYPDKVVYLTEG
ncbi:hypothetical protein PMJ6TS7_39950 [Paenibacillus melissococcoides]